MKEQLFYRYIKKKLPCFVFLHGWGGDSKVWQFMEKDILKLGFSYLAIDLPGHGLSYRLKKPMAMTDFAHEVKRIMDKEKINKAVLIGHCFGGMVAQEAAILTKKIKHLILICTHYKLPFWSKLGGFLQALKAFKIGPIKKHRDYKLMRKGKDIDFVRLWQDIKHVGSESYFNIFRGIKNWNFQKIGKKIALHVTILAGANDKIFPQKQQRQFAGIFKNKQLKFIKSNHIAPASYPEIVKRELLGFIKRSGLRPSDN